MVKEKPPTRSSVSPVESFPYFRSLISTIVSCNVSQLVIGDAPLKDAIPDPASIVVDLEDNFSFP